MSLPLHNQVGKPRTDSLPPQFGSSTPENIEGQLSRHSVRLESSGLPPKPRGEGLKHHSQVTVKSKPLLQREGVQSELSSSTGRLGALQGRSPTSFTRSEINQAMRDVAGDPRLEQAKDQQKPKGYWDKFVDWFSSGKFLKVVPKLLSGPVWSLIEGAKAERHRDRMEAVAHDARNRSGDERGTHNLPEELASALSGHYQLKAKKHDDVATISTIGMVASPVLGPLFSPIGSAASGLVGEMGGRVVQQGVSSLTSVAVKKGAQKLVAEPMREREHISGQSERLQAAQHITAELNEDSVQDIARTTRGFLRYLGLPPDKSRLESSDPGVRNQEMARLKLKRAMGGQVKTDYGQETRTVRDQLEKMTTSGTATPLFSSDGMIFAPEGVGSQERSTDYLRRMLVCEGMMEHSEESLNVKDT